MISFAISMPRNFFIEYSLQPCVSSVVNLRIKKRKYASGLIWGLTWRISLIDILRNVVVSRVSAGDCNIILGVSCVVEHCAVPQRICQCHHQTSICHLRAYISCMIGVHDVGILPHSN